MLGLADSNDPTPPIGLGLRGMGRHLLGPFIGLAWIAVGAIRIGSSFWDGLVHLVGGCVFAAIGVMRVVAWRRAAVRTRDDARGTEPTEPVASSIG